MPKRSRLLVYWDLQGQLCSFRDTYEVLLRSLWRDDIDASTLADLLDTRRLMAGRVPVSKKYYLQKTRRHCISLRPLATL